MDDTPADLLTDAEHRVMALTGELVTAFSRIVELDVSNPGDMREFIDHVHAIQNMVLAQAAARAYPDRYRLLGGKVGVTPDMVVAR